MRYLKLLFILAVLALTADIYIGSCLKFNVRNAAENKQGLLLSTVCPELRDVSRDCGWGLYPWKRRVSNERPSEGKETVWQNGQRRSRSSVDKSCSKRVCLIGCSYLFGSGLSDEQTLAWMLNQSYPDIRFDNYGSPGWGTLQCYLLEKRLLEICKYDLVCYFAINDHRERNTKYKFLGSLKAGQRYVMYPRAELKKNGELKIITSGSQVWPWEDRLNTVNFFHRVYIGFMSGYMQKKAELTVKDGRPYDRFMPMREEVFWRLTSLMAEEAAGRHTDFCLCLLEGEWPQWRYCPPPANPSYEIWKLSWPEIFNSEYRINYDVNEHPNQKANEMWCENFKKFFEARYGKNGVRLGEK